MNKVSVWGNECYYFGTRPTLQTACISPSVFFTLVILGALLVVAAVLMAAMYQQSATSTSASPHIGQNSSYLTPAQTPHPTPKNATPPSVTKSEAWVALKEFDADIQSAVASINGYGLQAEERLATAYLAVKDKDLLQAITKKIADDEEASRKSSEERASMREASLTARQKDLIADRESRARYTIDRIKSAGMIYNGKKVTSAELYYGDLPSDQGWAKIVYEDGSAELRAGTSFTAIGNE